MNKQTWEELSSRRTAANIKTWNAREKWHTAMNVNTLNKTDEEMTLIKAERIAAQAEYQRCHTESLEISDAANAAYRW